MKTSTRLIVILTILVGLILTVSSVIRLQQREGILQQALRNEMRAQSLTLQIALTNMYRAGSLPEAQLLVDRLSQNPKVYGVVVFDQQGQPLQQAGALSGLPQAVAINAARSVIASQQPVEITRQFNETEVFSLISPLTLQNGQPGAVELAQPTNFIKAEISRARQDIAIVTLPLFAAILLAVLIVMRYHIVRPIDALLRGAAALGRGDLSYRVPESQQGTELAQLAQEFNRMADSLAEQQKTSEFEAAQRLQLERTLRDTERMAALGRLAAGVAHEIGTPLNVIDARAEQLLERPASPLALRQRNLTIIRNQTDRITRIVQQLLHLARPYQLQRAPVAASQLLAEVLEMLEFEAKRSKVTVQTDCTEDVFFDVDAELIQQVLLNLCQNALQAMPTGGHLDIKYPGPFFLRNNERFARFLIHDTGKGIAPQHLTQIFDPFFTTKDVGSGTGLGLAVSRRITEEHGGWITANNHASGGAVFVVFLPVAKDLPANSAAFASPPGTDERNKAAV